MEEGIYSISKTVKNLITYEIFIFLNIQQQFLGAINLIYYTQTEMFH